MNATRLVTQDGLLRLRRRVLLESRITQARVLSLIDQELIPAAPAEAGLREALERIARRMEDWETECRREGVWRATSPDALMAVWVKEQARAALAAQEGAGE